MAAVHVRLVDARTPGQEAALLDGAAAGGSWESTTRDSVYAAAMHARGTREHGLSVRAGRQCGRPGRARDRVVARECVHERAGVGDLFGLGVFGADGRDTRI